MEYRDFGKTGIKVSKLGFGAMRFPETEKDGKWHIDEDKAIVLMHKAFKYGINYIDTANPYCHELSEITVGKALNDWKDRIYVSTKSPIWKLEKAGDYRMYLEKSLKRLNLDQIDFYHFHSLNEHLYEEKIIQFNLIDEAQKAKDEGLIKHISFSFHDDPKILKRFVNLEVFDSVLCQYNFLDRTNEEAIAYAVSKGVGVAVMGPVAGGRLLDLKTDDKRSMNDRDLVDMAFRFVFSNKNVSTALSGMGNVKMLKENIETAESPEELSQEEKEFIKMILENKEIKRMIPCNDCGYCIDCPNDIPISRIFKIYNYNLLTKIIDNARWQYNLIGAYNDNKSKADQCSECGECEEKCPQNIEIIDMLKKAHKTLKSAE